MSKIFVQKYQNLTMGLQITIDNDGDSF